MGGSLETELKAVEREIQLLKVNYERFFSGDLKAPPLPARRRLEEFLKRLGNSEIERAVDRFRLQSLQGRWAALVELWEKRLAARDEGRAIPGRTSLNRPAVPPADAARAASVQASGRVDLSPLFERYRQARAALGEDVSGLRLDRFEEFVKKQADEIRRRTGSTRLVFEVKSEGGKVRLVARPAPPKGSGST